MTEEEDEQHPQVDAVTANEVVTGMTDEQLAAAWDAAEDLDNLTDVEEAVLAEIERRQLNL
ncbi:hypothetical protein [Novosphingobium resinovorum]|uniref:Uncharacterized protein n=1 Tax=Novosphingobium resinovorum TaxID=158500 RepID=A0A1D8AF66_9SPHN|nr:hypothetical protein [Novosphingobium resinovorum]AOR80747.1 hypothetical protein BES08_28470 [Novosphingobium resinovorum]